MLRVAKRYSDLKLFDEEFIHLCFPVFLLVALGASI